MLVDLVRDAITFEEINQSSSIAGNKVFEMFDMKPITDNEADLAKLDDIEARMLIDLIITYSGLEYMRLNEVQASLGLKP